MSVYDFSATDIQGTERNLSEFEGKVLLIVNTASKCGFTPQFEGLEKMYKDLNDKGLEVLGFPCNQFAQQDKGSDSEIAGFCMKNYGVSFPMFSKIEVNGEGQRRRNRRLLYEKLRCKLPNVFKDRSERRRGAPFI